MFFKDQVTVIAKLRATIVWQFGSIGAHSNGVLSKLWTRLCDHTCDVRIPLKTFFLGILRDSFLILISLMIILKAETNRTNCRCSLNQRTPANITLFIPGKTPWYAKRYISDKEKNKKAWRIRNPIIALFWRFFQKRRQLFFVISYLFILFYQQGRRNLNGQGETPIDWWQIACLLISNLNLTNLSLSWKMMLQTH